MSEEYSRALARVVVAQLAAAGGYEAVHDTAGEVLSELLVKYIAQLCASAKGYAELTGRTDINVADATLALEDLGESIEELDSYTRIQGVDIPFRHAVAPFPIRKQLQPPPSFQEQHEPNPAHIPSFLPAFPDAHTYNRTPAFGAHEEDPHKQRQAVRKVREDGQAALLSLQQKILSRRKADELRGITGQQAFLVPTSVEVIDEEDTGNRTPASEAQHAHDPGTNPAAAAAGAPELLGDKDIRVQVTDATEDEDQSVAWRKVPDETGAESLGPPADWTTSTRQAALLSSGRKKRRHASAADAAAAAEAEAGAGRKKARKHDAADAANARALMILEAGSHQADLEEEDKAAEI